MSNALLRRLQLAGGIAALGTGLVLVGSVAGPALAASTGSTTANASVNSTLTMSGLTPSFTLSGDPNTTVTAAGAVTMNVLTNNKTGYTVSVQAAGSTMAAVTTGNTDSIPIANLKVRETGTTTYTSLNNSSPVTVHSQATKSASSSEAVSNDFSLAIPFVNSDTYRVTLNYVAAAQ